MKQHKHLLVLLFFIGFGATSAQAQVKLGNNPSSIASTSLLELESDSLTFVLPRMTTTQRNAIIGTPLQGSLIYNLTDACIQRFNGTSWACLVSSDVDLNIGDDELNLSANRTLNLNGHSFTFRNGTANLIKIPTDGQLNLTKYGNAIARFPNPQPAYILGVNSQGDVVELKESDIFAGGVHWDSITNVPANIADGDNQRVDTFSLSGTTIKISLQDDGITALTLDLGSTFATDAELAASDLADKDKDSTNEIQTLTSSNSTVSITASGINYDLKVNVPALETTTTISYNSTLHEINYVDEDGNTTNLNLNVGSATYTGSTHTLKYTAEDGTVTNLVLNEGAVSYNTSSNVLTYTDESGDATSITLNTSSIAQNTSSGVITHTSEDGTTQTANVVSSNTNNDVSAGSDGGAFLNVQDHETVTSITYNSTLHEINYVDEDGNTTNLDLNVGTASYTGSTHTLKYTAEDGTVTNLTLNEGAISYNTATNVLTYTDESGDVTTLNLNEVAYSDVVSGTKHKIGVLTDEANGTTDVNETVTTTTQAANGSITHNSENGTTQNSVLVSTDAKNDISSGTDKGNFLDVQAKETTTIYTDATTSPKHKIGSYTNEDTVTVDVNETTTIMTFLNTGTVNQKRTIARYKNEAGDSVNIKESVVALTYDGNDEELEFTDENGNANQFAVNIYGRNGDLTGDRFVNFNNNSLKFENNVTGNDLVTFKKTGELIVNQYTGTTFYNGSPTNNILTVTSAGNVREANITDLETTTSYIDSTTAPKNAIGSYKDEDGNLTTIYENISELKNTLASGHKIGDYTDEDGVNTVINETVTTISYDAVDHEIDYVDENGNNQNLNLNVGTASYNSATHEIKYTAEDGTVTTLALNIGVISYNTSTNDLTYVDEDGVTTTINLNESSIAQNTTSGVITHTSENGSTQTANVVSTDALNDVSVGSDGGAYVDVQAKETLTTIAYNSTSHEITYVDEDTVSHVLDLNVGTAAYNSATHEIKYTAEDGTVTTLVLNIGVISYNTSTNDLTYVDEDGVTTTINLNESSIAQNTTSGVITHTSENGSTQTANVVSTDALNDVSVGSDGGAYVDVQAKETLTTIAYNSTSHEITYVDEDTVSHVLDLNVGTAAYNSATHEIKYTAEDGTVTTLMLNVGAISYNSATNNLAYVDEDGVTTTINLNESSTAQAANGSITHTSEDGATQTSVLVSTDALNDISSGTDKGNFLDVQAKETTTFYTDATSAPLRHKVGSYTNEDTVTVDVNETLTVLTNNNTGTTNQKRTIATYKDEAGTDKAIKESVVELTYDGTDEELEFIDETGYVSQFPVNIYGKNGHLTGNRWMDFGTHKLTFRDVANSKDLFQFQPTGELELKQYSPSNFYDGNPVNNILTVKSDGDVRQANITDLETTTTYTNYVMHPDTHAIGVYVNEDGADTTIYETITAMSQAASTGVITYTDETGTDATANVTSTDTDQDLNVGADGGTYLNVKGDVDVDGSGDFQIQPLAVGTPELANDAVTNAKLADDAVQTENILNAAVTTAKLADGSVTTVKLDADAVTNAKIADDAVQTENILDAAVTTAKLADGSVTTVKIANDAVDKDKIAADVAGNGLGQNASGALEVNVDDVTIEITSDVLNVKTGGIGTTQLADGSVTTVKLAADAVTNAKLADDAVKTENILDGQVMTADLADGSVTTAKLDADAVTNAKLADDAVQTENILNAAVTTAKLDADAVTNAKLADDAVQTENILNDAVTTAKIADNAVTVAKIADGGSEQMLTTDGSGNPQWENQLAIVQEHETNTTITGLNTGAGTTQSIGVYNNEDAATYDIRETITTVTGASATGNTIATHKSEDGTSVDIKETITSVASVASVTATSRTIANYQPETGAVEPIKESITSAVQADATTGDVTFTHESGTSTFDITSSDADNDLKNGTDGGTYLDLGATTNTFDIYTTGPVKLYGDVFIGNASSDNLEVVSTSDFKNNVTLGSDATDLIAVKGTATFSAEATFNKGIIVKNPIGTTVLETISGGQLKLAQYGMATSQFPGTAKYNISVDANGNLIETSAGPHVSADANNDLAAGSDGGSYLDLDNGGAGITANIYTKGNLKVTNGSFTAYGSPISLGNSGSDQININAKVNLTLASIPTSNATAADYGLFLDASGNLNKRLLTVNAANFSIPSDRRYKQNIRPISSALNTLIQFNGVNYEMKDEFKDLGFRKDGVKQFGLIAQEVELIAPELVFTDENGMKSVYYQAFVPVLIEAIKDQQKQIEDQKAQLAAQGEQLAELQNANTRLSAQTAQIELIKATLESAGIQLQQAKK